MTSKTNSFFSSQRLAQFDNLISKKYLDTKKLPGFITMIYRNDKIQHINVMGSMDVERARPMTEDTIFRIYSMTKPITSVAFMKLVERGQVYLDTEVSDLIPEWANLAVYEAGSRSLGEFKTHPAPRKMLVLDLLRHTSGLTYGFQAQTNVDAAYRELRIGDPSSPGGLSGMINDLSTLPLDYSPGDFWKYSISTHVLGYLIEKISGVTFPEFLQREIFEPIEMVDTGFWVPQEKKERLAACYGTDPKKGMILLDDPFVSSYLEKPLLASGGSGLVSTAKDYMRFCQMLLNKGSLAGNQILSRKTVELMTMNHLPDNKSVFEMSKSVYSEGAYPGLGFGLGFAVTTDVAKSLQPGSQGDFFWGGGASTYFWIDPIEDMIVLFMTQMLPSTTYDIRKDLRHWIYSAFGN